MRRLFILLAMLFLPCSVASRGGSRRAAFTAAAVRRPVGAGAAFLPTRIPGAILQRSLSKVTPKTPVAFTRTTLAVANEGGGGGEAEGTTTASPPSSTSPQTQTQLELSRLTKALFTTSYEPNPNDTPFMDRLQSQTTPSGVQVQVAVLTGAESRRYFGVGLAQRGVQAVYLEIDNTLTDNAVFLDRVGIDPNYFSATEAAALCRLANPKLLVKMGFLSAFFFLPLAVLLPFKMISSFPANQRMEQFFQEHEFPLGICPPNSKQRGFLYTSLDNGAKFVPVVLYGKESSEKLSFNVPLADLKVDFQKGESLTNVIAKSKTTTSIQECADIDALKQYLEQETPRAVTNKEGTREGDPVNLVVTGDFETVLATFTSARWDQTEIINIASCSKMVKSFLFRSEYRYSPVSALYLDGRPQDFALQRARDTINERLHLRLWWTPRLWQGKTVWVGQVSRDIGVKLAKTWNLTTHRIDPAVDEARDYVLSSMLGTGHLSQLGYVQGVGESTSDAPRVNLGEDPFITDGKRVVLSLSESKTKPKLIGW